MRKKLERLLTLSTQLNRKSAKGGIVLPARAVEGHTEKRMYASPDSTCCPVKLFNILSAKNLMLSTMELHFYINFFSRETVYRMRTGVPINGLTLFLLGDEQELGQYCKVWHVKRCNT